MSQIVGSEIYDRVFSGAVFGEVDDDDRVFHVYALTDDLAEEIGEKFSHHLATVAAEVTGLPIDWVTVMTVEYR